VACRGVFHSASLQDDDSGRRIWIRCRRVLEGTELLVLGLCNVVGQKDLWETGLSEVQRELQPIRAHMKYPLSAGLAVSLSGQWLPANPQRGGTGLLNSAT
jgi:hypothetical protein